MLLQNEAAQCIFDGNPLMLVSIQRVGTSGGDADVSSTQSYEAEIPQSPLDVSS
jgi:hypothetical protein